MTGTTPIRQFKGCCVLIQVQIARSSQTYDLEESFRMLTANGKLKDDDVAFIRRVLEMERELKAGGELDEDEVAAAIPRIQMLVASNLNCADSA